MSGWILTAVLLGGGMSFGCLGAAAGAEATAITPHRAENDRIEIPADLAGAREALVKLDWIPGLNFLDIHRIEGSRFMDLEAWILDHNGRVDAFSLPGFGHDGASIKGLRAIVPAQDFDTAMETVKGLRTAMTGFVSGGAR